MQREFQERYSGRYFGKYRAYATEVDTDPRTLGRIKMICPLVLGEEESGWCLPDPPTGGGLNTGMLTLPRRNDYLWVEFEEGDPERPIWTHGAWGIRKGESMVPRHSQGKPDYTDYSRRDYGNIPPSQFEGNYGYVQFLGARDGSFLELDSTPSKNRLQLSHASGTRLEMQSDGGAQEIVTQSLRKHIGSNLDVEIVGKEKRFIGNEQSIIVNGDVSKKVAGSVTETYKEKTVEGQRKTETYEESLTTSVKGTWTQKVFSQALLQVGGQFSVNAAQNVLLTASENLEIVGMNANGQTSAPQINDALVIQGYNGNTVLKASDATGLVSNPTITLSGLPGPTLGQIKLEAGLPSTGKISILPIPLANVLLGGSGAIQPVVLGTNWTLLYVTLIGILNVVFSAMQTDKGLEGVAPATVKAAGAAVTALSAHSTAIATGAHLSKVVMSK